MPRFSSTATPIVTRPVLSVYIGGVLRPDVMCTGISKRGNWSPDSATLSVPAWLAGDYDTSLDDMAVLIYQQGMPLPVFRGYIDTASMQESARESGVTLTALSITDKLDRVHIGQAALRGEVQFRKRDPLTRGDYGYTVTNIFEAIFGTSTLDANWRSVIEWGDLTAISRTRGDLRPADMRFTGQSVLQALRRVNGLVADVGFREIHTESKTYYSAFVYGDPTTAAKTLIAPLGNGYAEGAIIADIQGSGDNKGIVSRVIAYGAPRKFQITLATNHSTAPVLPAWTDATITGYAEDGTTYTETEDAVIANPDSTIAESPHFVAARANVFRRYKLPAALLAFYKPQSQNLYRMASGKQIGLQVFRVTYPLTVSGTELVADTNSPEYELLTGHRITEDGYLELPRPCLAEVRKHVVSGKQVSTYAPVHLFVTLTVSASDGTRPGYDTGVRGYVNTPTIRDTGLVFPIVNNSVEYWQIGTPAGGLTDWLGAAHSIGCVWYDEESNTWSAVAAGSSTVIRDDRLFLASIAERALAERQKRRTTATVRLPYIATGFNVGDVVKIRNRGIDGKRLTVFQVAFDYAGINTRLYLSDQVPDTVQVDAEPAKTRQPAIVGNPQWPAYSDRLSAYSPAAPGTANSVPSLPVINTSPNAIGLVRNALEMSQPLYRQRRG
jgi:hypothetical protein